MRQKCFEQRDYCVFLSNALVWAWTEKNLPGKGNSVPYWCQSSWFDHEYAKCSEHREYFAVFVSISLVWVRDGELYALFVSELGGRHFATRIP